MDVVTMNFAPAHVSPQRGGLLKGLHYKVRIMARESRKSLRAAESADGLVKALQAFDVPLQLSDGRTEVTDVLPMFFLTPTFAVEAMVFTAQRRCPLLQRPMFGLEIGWNV